MNVYYYLEMSGWMGKDVMMLLGQRFDYDYGNNAYKSWGQNILHVRQDKTRRDKPRGR